MGFACAVSSLPGLEADRHARESRRSFFLAPKLTLNVRQADGQHVMRREKPVDLEDASRIMQKCFSACLNDR